MPQARGSQIKVGLYEETVYGVNPAAVGTLLYVTSIGIKGDQELLSPQTLTSFRSEPRPARGAIDTRGQFETEISAENLPTLIKHLLGSSGTSGANPYAHTAVVDALPVGLMVEVDYGSNISGNGRVEQHNGIRLNNGTFRFPAKGYCTASFDVIGSSSTLASTALDATYTDNGHTPFSSFQASITEGGSAIATVTDLTIVAANNLDDGNYTHGNSGKRRALPEGIIKVTGTLTALFESAALLEKAINDTTSAIAMTLSRGNGLGSVGNESMLFSMANLVYARTSPDVRGPGGIVTQFAFTAFRPTAGTSPLVVLTKNAVALV